MTPEQKAMRTLRRFLDDEQKRTLSRHGYIDVVGASGRCYRLRDGFWVQRHRAPRISAQRWGIVACETGSYDPYRLPQSDRLLAQLLHLRADDRRVQRIACHASIAHVT